MIFHIVSMFAMESGHVDFFVTLVSDMNRDGWARRGDVRVKLGLEVVNCIDSMRSCEHRGLS